MVFYYIYPIMQGISTVIVLVRVEMGFTYGVDSDDNEISKTAIDFASSTATTTPSSSDK